jgi:MFS family permease
MSVLQRPTRESAPPAGGGAWRVLALLTLGVAVCHFNRISISVAGAERIMPGYGVDPRLMGLVYSAYLFSYTLCMTPGGWLIDRLGPWAALLLLGAGSAVFVALTGVAGLLVTAPALLVAALLGVRALLGVVSAPIHPGSARMISLWVPPGRQATWNGLVCASACVGIAGTYLLFGQLMDWFDWPGAFLVAAAGTALLAVVWALLAADPPAGLPAAGAAGPEAAPGRPAPRPAAGEGVVPAPGVTSARPPPLLAPDEDEDGGFAPLPGGEVAFLPRRRDLNRRETFLALLRQRSLILLTASYAALGYFQYLFFYWIEYYFKDVLKLDKGTSRLNATILTLSMGVGMFAGGWLADRAAARLGPRRGRALVPMAGLLVSAVVLGAGLLSGDPTAMLVCFAVSMATAGASEGAFWTTAIALGGRLGGTSAAVLNTGGNAGGLLAPIVTPLFSHYFGWKAGIALACVPCVVGAALWLWIDASEGEGGSVGRK